MLQVTLRVGMVSRQNSSELPPPYSTDVDDTCLQGFPHPPGYRAISTDDAADETAANSSSEAGSDTDRWHGNVRVSLDNSLPSYDAANTNTRWAFPNQTTAVGSYPSSSPPAYTPATAPPRYQRQQALRPNENYISISNRILAATQPDGASPANGESSEKDDSGAIWCSWICVCSMCFLTCCILPRIV